MHGLLCIDEQKSNIKCNYFFFLHQNPEHFFCKRLFNRLHCSKLNTCHHCAHVSCFMWLLSHRAQMVFEFWRCLFFLFSGIFGYSEMKKKKSFLYGHLEVLMGGAGGEVTVAAKILATSEISTFLVFKQGAFYHSNGYSCTLFNTGTQKSVVDAWGPLLDHIFFLFPTPTHTHTLSSAV